MMRKIAVTTLLLLVVSQSADAGIFRKRRVNTNQVVWNPQTGRYQTNQTRMTTSPPAYRYRTPPVRTYVPTQPIPTRPQAPAFTRVMIGD